MNVKERSEIERKIVAFLFNTMAQHDWHIDYIFDGGDNVRHADWTEAAVLYTVFSVDESLIRFMKSAMRRSGRIILGNDGCDCIADHSLSDTSKPNDDFEAVTKLVDDYSTSLQSLEAGGSQMKRHELKTDPDVFQAVLEGRKTYEIRKNDRGFAVGDELLLRETRCTGSEIAAGRPLEYTGRELTVGVSHMLTGPVYGLSEGWSILSIQPPKGED